MSEDRRLRVVDALERTAELPEVPLYVALLHGKGCLCSVTQAVVVGPFVNPHPMALLGWAQQQCEAGLVARMVPPSAAARQVTGSR